MTDQIERFVDQSDKPIPAADTWEDLSINQLIDVKNHLVNKTFTFKQPQIVAVLRKSIERLDSMISARSL